MSTTLAREADALRAQIRALEQKFLPMPEQERNEIAAAQARADSVARQFGDVGATQPLPNETAIQFRKRLLGNYKKHSPAYRGANIEMIGDRFDSRGGRRSYICRRNQGCARSGEL